MGASRGRGSALGATSRFQQAAADAGLVAQPGKSALAPADRGAVEAKGRARFTGSLDLDAAFLAAEPNSPRWDYAVGVAGSDEKLFWIEPHPASSTGEVARMLAKLDWLKSKLARPEFAALHALTQATSAEGASPFLWLYAGSNRILPNSREARLLASKGLSLPRRHLELS